uniref:Elicitor-responsive protein 1 n=2 Tax=Cajanus cajan TaxID=3821 RepID=A0A151U9M4_CAJCA|nr:Elicitor-responsive protein 1 [Cajanus cajan]
MDKDNLSKDDFVGQATIYVEDLLAIGVKDGVNELQLLKYRVVRADQSYCGEIDVGVTFKVEEDFIGKVKQGWKDTNKHL